MIASTSANRLDADQRIFAHSNPFASVVTSAPVPEGVSVPSPKSYDPRIAARVRERDWKLTILAPATNRQRDGLMTMPAGASEPGAKIMSKGKKAGALGRLPWLTRLLEEIERSRERKYIQPSLPFAPDPQDTTGEPSIHPPSKKPVPARTAKKASNYK